MIVIGRFFFISLFPLVKMFYQDEEPSGDEWYRSKDPDEQAFIKKTMDQCPDCGEYVSKGVLEKNGGICRICRRRNEGYEQF